MHVLRSSNTPTNDIDDALLAGCMHKIGIFMTTTYHFIYETLMGEHTVPACSTAQQAIYLVVPSDLMHHEYSENQNQADMEQNKITLGVEKKV